MSTQRERRSVYYTPKWRDFRERALKNAGFLCEHCKSDGRIVSARLVHHKKAIREGGEPFDAENLVALCNECHAEIHNRRRVPDAWDSWIEDFSKQNEGLP